MIDLRPQGPVGARHAEQEPQPGDDAVTMQMFAPVSAKCSWKRRMSSSVGRSVGACLPTVPSAILSPWAPSHAKPFTAHPIRQSEQPEARKEADRFAVEAGNKRMLTFQGPGAAITDAGRCDQHRI